MSLLGATSPPARGPALLRRDGRLAVLQKMLWCDACVGTLADTKKAHQDGGAGGNMKTQSGLFPSRSNQSLHFDLISPMLGYCYPCSVILQSLQAKKTPLIQSLPSPSIPQHSHSASGVNLIEMNKTEGVKNPKIFTVTSWPKYNAIYFL